MNPGLVSAVTYISDDECVSENETDTAAVIPGAIDAEHQSNPPDNAADRWNRVVREDPKEGKR